MEAKEDSGYRIVWLIRRLFRALGQTANEYLRALGISAADRAVLEFLYPAASLSVPEIAAKYQVSRQHVQVTVNGLLIAGLLMTRDNPRHKRSPLVALTDDGRKLFGRIRAREKEIVAGLFSEVPDKDRAATERTLNILLRQLS